MFFLSKKNSFFSGTDASLVGQAGKQDGWRHPEFFRRKDSLACQMQERWLPVQVGNVRANLIFFIEISLKAFKLTFLKNCKNKFSFSCCTHTWAWQKIFGKGSCKGFINLFEYRIGHKIIILYSDLWKSWKV